MTTINGITGEEVKARLKEINKDTPIIWTASLMNAPSELTARTVTRNNIMLDKILENQAKIMDSQKVIMDKLGTNLDVKG